MTDPARKLLDDAVKLLEGVSITAFFYNRRKDIVSRYAALPAEPPVSTNTVERYGYVPAPAPASQATTCDVGRVAKVARLLAGRGLRQFAKSIGIDPSRCYEIESTGIADAQEWRIIADALEARRQETLVKPAEPPAGSEGEQRLSASEFERTIMADFSNTMPAPSPAPEAVSEELDFLPSLQVNALLHALEENANDIKAKLLRLSVALSDERRVTPSGEVERVKDLEEQVNHWRVKATCYGNIVHGCSPELEKAGFPVDSFAPDGAVGGIARAVKALTAELAALKSRAESLAKSAEAVSCAFEDIYTDRPDAEAAINALQLEVVRYRDADPPLSAGESKPERLCGKSGCPNPASGQPVRGSLVYETCDAHRAEIEALVEAEWNGHRSPAPTNEQ